MPETWRGACGLWPAAPPGATGSNAHDAGLLGRREMFDRVDKGIIEEGAAIEEINDTNQMIG